LVEEAEIMLSLSTVLTLFGISLSAIAIAVGFFVKLRSDVSSLKGEISNLQNDMRELRTNHTLWWPNQVTTSGDLLNNTNTERVGEQA